ncbi:MAG: amidohydrolase family protein [Proteobacteria bacterium]|nr:amidohydrolase family protein [Pseudomonadota bacterium]
MSQALYDGPMIDTHHHIWLRKDVAWLADPPVPRMFGDYFGIRRDYPVEEWMADIVPQGAVKSVHVTAMWGPGKALEETKWLQAVADKHGYPHGIIANVDLAAPDAGAALKAQMQYPNVRGVRHMLYYDKQPERQGCPRPDFCNDANFRRGFAALEQHDLHFELQIYPYQARYAAELLKAHPNVRMILVHAGMLTERTSAAIDEWRAALTMLAAFPNLHVKLSGLGMYSLGLTYPQARQVIRDTIQIFGIERTLYGSNFPLEKLHLSYADFFAIYRRVMAEYPAADQRAVFHDNAARFYRLSDKYT